MKPVQGRLKRIGASPIKPRKLLKKDIYPTNGGEKIEESNGNVNNKEKEEEKDETPTVTKPQVHTNPTVLSKQIKIVSQLNAKQINDLISDRNTIKAHGLQENMTYYDSFSSDLVDIVYYQAIAEGICIYDDAVELHKVFNENEEKITSMLRKAYVNDDRTSNLEKIKEITFEGTSQEEYFKTLINLRKLESTLQMSSEEEKLSMDHFKRKLIPSSPFSRDLKSILINHLFGNKETEVTTIKQFIRMFIEKMKEVQEIAEKARHDT